MKDKKALVLLSGGQDSTTCLYWAKQNFKEVIAVGFNYGQKHIAELEQAKKIAIDANIEYIIFDIKGMLNGSSLTDHVKDHNDTQNDLPQSFTAGRNLLFIASVLNYCYLNNIEDIVTGTCQTDFSGYPDCRRNFINSMELALSLATDKDYRIHTPLMYLTKAETWKLAKELECLDIVINDSMTDYNGSKVRNEWGFGELNNGASELRAKGFYEAKEKGWI